MDNTQSISNVKYIPLTQGRFAIINEEDFEEVNKYRWNFNSGYAKHNYYTNGKKKEKLFLHRFILKAKTGEMVDHINGDKLDNRRCNLRVCSHNGNMRNRGIQKNNTSGYKGVHKEGNKFKARIRVSGKLLHIGMFNTAKIAAIEYNKMAVKLHGDFARLNLL